MAYLYAVLFSSGTIKVGRSDDSPDVRIRQHADRLSVAGITCVRQVVAQCCGSAVRAECRLIARCVDVTTRQLKSEWFEGLDFDTVAAWLQLEAGEIGEPDVLGPGFDGPVSPTRRREIARATGRSAAYLYQVLTRRREMNPAEAMTMETLTKGELRRWDLCHKNWHRVWPDLIGAEGAPEVPDLASTPEPAEA